MKVTGDPIAVGVGVVSIGIALISAILILPGSKGSESPLLYVCVFGGLFVGISAVLGIAVVYEHLYNRNRSRVTGHR